MMSFHQVNDGNLIFGQYQRYFKYDFLGRVISDKRLPKGFIDFFARHYRNAEKAPYPLRVSQKKIIH